MIDRRLRDRYSRQMMFEEIGESGQAKLLASYAVVIGCGALGGTTATLLVRAGVGRVRVVDRDFIETHNLQRQLLFDEDDIRCRLPKAIAAERHLRRINSTVHVEGLVVDVNHTNVEALCDGADIIVDGLDNLGTRFMINDVSLKRGIPWVYGGAVAANGMTMTYLPGEPPCLRCLFHGVSAAGTAPTCETAGIVGTVPAIVAALEATQAIRVLLKSASIDRTLTFVDPWHGTYRHITVAPRKDCPACQGRYDFLQGNRGVIATSLCGQSRAVQVFNSDITRISLEELAAKLIGAGNPTRNEFMLTFTADGHEIVVFPDARAIIRGTIDESLGREIYNRYVAGPLGMAG